MIDKGLLNFDEYQEKRAMEAYEPYEPADEPEPDFWRDKIEREKELETYRRNEK